MGMAQRCVVNDVKLTVMIMALIIYTMLLELVSLNISLINNGNWCHYHFFNNVVIYFLKTLMVYYVVNNFL